MERTSEDVVKGPSLKPVKGRQGEREEAGLFHFMQFELLI